MRYPLFSFSYEQPHSHSRARLGRISTPHGVVETPSFIFCATKADIKSVPIDAVKDAGTQIILSNTYHLMLQPGADLVEKMGGLQKFTGWNKPMLTDSGGFQIFSLGHGSIADEIKGKGHSRNKSLLKISEEGALFKSYLDGKEWFLTPEKSIEVQGKLGADLIVVLDECTPFHVEKEYTSLSMRRSHRWAIRSLEAFDRLPKKTQALYGIIQGGVYPDLRTESCDFVNSEDFFGHAIGGSLGASKDQMYDIVSLTMENLSKDRPVHLLGIGGVSDIFSGIKMGIDTFDCVHPTRLGRHGGALVKKQEKEHINLRNSRYKEDNKPIEDDCSCTTCETYTRAYLHHLLKAKEILAHTLITIHNITFMNRLLEDIRNGIRQGAIDDVEKTWRSV